MGGIRTPQHMADLTVLHIIDSLGAGGAERSLAEMLPRFEGAGIRSIVCCLEQRHHGVASSVLEREGDVRILDRHRLVPRVGAFRRMLTEEDPDLVHTTLFASTIVGRLATRRTGIPVLSSLVNTPYTAVRRHDPKVKSLALTGVRVVDALSARWTTHFHAITHAVKDAAIDTLHVAPDRITVIPRGRSRDRLGEPSRERRSAVRASLGLTDDAAVLISVGRQEYQKGQQLLLEAMPAILARTPDTVLLIAGRRGAASAALDDAHRRLTLGDRVRFLGHRDDVPDLLVASDLLVFPSLFEGLGGTLLEAMALGTPIVASDVPAIREVLADGDVGLLVEPGSASALASAVWSALRDQPSTERRRRAAVERFATEYSIERTTDHMIELYQRIAAAR